MKDFDPEAEVTTIETPNTSVLSCLGDMIDASPQNPVYINVHRLRDETIPEYFRERGLTNGGMWLATNRNFQIKYGQGCRGAGPIQQ